MHKKTFRDKLSDYYIKNQIWKKDCLFLSFIFFISGINYKCSPSFCKKLCKVSKFGDYDYEVLTGKREMEISQEFLDKCAVKIAVSIMNMVLDLHVKLSRKSSVQICANLPSPISRVFAELSNIYFKAFSSKELQLVKGYNHIMRRNWFSRQLHASKMAKSIQLQDRTTLDKQESDPTNGFSTSNVWTNERSYVRIISIPMGGMPKKF